MTINDDLMKFYRIGTKRFVGENVDCIRVFNYKLYFLKQAIRLFQLFEFLIERKTYKIIENHLKKYRYIPHSIQLIIYSLMVKPQNQSKFQYVAIFFVNDMNYIQLSEFKQNLALNANAHIVPIFFSHSLFLLSKIYSKSTNL